MGTLIRVIYYKHCTQASRDVALGIIISLLDCNCKYTLYQTMPKLSDTNAVAISQQHPSGPREPLCYQKSTLQVYGSGSMENGTFFVNC